MDDERIKWFLYGYLACAVLDLVIKVAFHPVEATVLEFPASPNGAVAGEVKTTVEEILNHE